MTTKTKNILKMTGILLATFAGMDLFGGNDAPKSPRNKPQQPSDLLHASTNSPE